MAHRVEAMASVRRWALANPGKVKSYIKACVAKKPEQYRLMYVAKQARRRARQAEATLGPYTRLDFVQQCTAQQGRCYWCGVVCEALTLEHVVPLARGGAHAAANIVGACSPCNNRKGARTWPRSAAALEQVAL